MATHSQGAPRGNGCLEVERREKRIGSSLEAAPIVYIDDKDLLEAFDGQSAADIFITSQAELKLEKPTGTPSR